MGEGGRGLAEVLRTLTMEGKEGLAPKALDRLACQLIHKSGAKPAFLNYRPAGARKPYPYTLCSSVNEVVVHGQPSDYILHRGDVLKLDLGLLYKGFFLDAAVTVGVGKITKEAQRLISTTKKGLYTGIVEAKPGNTLGDIGFKIAAVAEQNKCSVVDGVTAEWVVRA